MNIKKLISIAAIGVLATVGVLAQDQYVRQYHVDRQTVVGVVNTTSGNAAGVSIPNATTVTNQLASSMALAGGTVPPGQGRAWKVYGSTLGNTAPLTNAYLFVTTTGTGNQAGWSVKQLQGSPDNGGTWVNSLVVSNALPTATNTITTNMPIPVVNFAGFTDMRIFSLQNTCTNAGPAGSTNNISESDQILFYH